MCLSSIFCSCAEQYILLLCVCYMEEWFWHLSSLFRMFVMGNGSGDHVVLGETKFSESVVIQWHGWCPGTHLVWHGK
jgi:hypothetical protein